VPKQPNRAFHRLSSGARLPALALALAAALLGACAAAEPREDPLVEVRDALPGLAGIPQEGDALGEASAPVTLVELADLRCGHCRAFVNVTLPILLDRYVRPGKLRIVFKNLPILGPASVQAARMAAALGMQGHEFEFVDAFFRESPGIVSAESLRGIAAQIPGVDVAAAEEAQRSTAVDADLTEARELAQRHGVIGTPTFLLGRTGADPEVVSAARAAVPATLTGPIDALLAQQ
jgi:protein-disulfide isomerase